MSGFVPEFKAGVRRTPPQLLVDIPESAVPEQPKKKKTPTYNLTWEQIEAMKRDACREASRVLWELMLGLPVMVLNDKHDFTMEQLDVFVDDVLDLYDSYEQGYLTLQDVETALKDEVGIIITEKYKKRKANTNPKYRKNGFA